MRNLLSVIFFSIATVVAPTRHVAACEAVDYLAIPVNSASVEQEQEALQMAFPNIRFSDDGARIFVEGNWLDFGRPRDILPATLIREASILEQFAYVYPLEDRPDLREASFFDPGRPRNDLFFKTLFHANDSAAQVDLVAVAAPNGEIFRVTTKHNVACQLSVAFAAVAMDGVDYRKVFEAPGGGFNWRVVSGTSHLSPHSFGIAIDVNPQLGQYWKWTGRPEGDAGTYTNKIPMSLVQTMERYGFIWGGKWHHYDGMHFEYRPELILYSRMIGIARPSSVRN